VFDVLIGINLLREGLDIPEVSLVAIFDADKEGFLRSARSLIQTIGRASRNSEGRAILYADRITPAMKLAMEETERRRAKQHANNLKIGMTPKTIFKQVTDIMPGAREAAFSESMQQDLSGAMNLDSLTSDQLVKRIKQLEKQMREHAKNLEFEAAVTVREELIRVKKALDR
jgi:excinuclease ABC subunit B